MQLCKHSKPFKPKQRSSHRDAQQYCAKSIQAAPTKEVAVLMCSHYAATFRGSHPPAEHWFSVHSSWCDCNTVRQKVCNQGIIPNGYAYASSGVRDHPCPGGLSPQAGTLWGLLRGRFPLTPSAAFALRMRSVCPGVAIVRMHATCIYPFGINPQNAGFRERAQPACMRASRPRSYLIPNGDEIMKYEL
jgi:hypothetical protein